MGDLVPFEFEGKTLRVVGTTACPLFPAVDVCSVLGHSNARKAVADLVDEDDVTAGDIIDSVGRIQKTNLVNESGLYALIFGSRRPEAKRFKRWVTHEVLPAIRKTGRYEKRPALPAPRNKATPTSFRFTAEMIDRLEISSERTGLKKVTIIERAFDDWFIKQQVEMAERERLIEASKRYLLSKPIP